jgi:hypothetical protein
VSIVILMLILTGFRERATRSASRRIHRAVSVGDAAATVIVE